MIRLTLAALVLLTPAAHAAGPTKRHPITVGTMKISAAQLRHWEQVARRSSDLGRREARLQTVLMLVDARWVRGSARRAGLVVTTGEVETALQEQREAAFPDDADFRAFLRETGQTLSDLRFRVRTDLYSTKLREHVEAGAADDEDRRARLDAFVAEHDAYWRPRTRCARRYYTALRCARR